MKLIYEGYLYHEICRWCPKCDIIVTHYRTECFLCLTPIEECDKLEVPTMVNEKETRPAGNLGMQEEDFIKEETILEKAEQLVMGSRQEKYGSPKENHECTAKLWITYLRRRAQVYAHLTGDNEKHYEISAVDVCFLNMLQKISRCANEIAMDSLVDIPGYARCIERIMEPPGVTLGQHTFVPAPLRGEHDTFTVCNLCRKPQSHPNHLVEESA